MLPIIVLKPQFHSGKEVMLLPYPNNKLDYQLKKLMDIRFSHTYNCWYLPLSKTHYLLLKEALKDKAILDTTLLKQYLEQRKAFLPSTPMATVSKARAELLLQYPLNDQNLKSFQEFQHLLQLKGYSPHTIRTYSNEFHCLLRLLGAVCARDLTKQHIQSYLLWLLKKKGYSESHVHTAVNALKFYYEQVEKRQREFYDLPRPKRPVVLPDILAGEEMKAIIQGTENFKHKTLLMTAYSAGLRVSELVSLQIRDIDSKRMMIHIRQGKGKKDRYVPLSQKLLETLRIYFKAYQPKGYLFEGEKGAAYSPRSAQMVLAAAKAKARVVKQGGIHLLRHSYATHLLEAGIDIRYIQDFLGHNNIKTTLRYTHVTQKHIVSIQSPLDKLDL